MTNLPKIAGLEDTRMFARELLNATDYAVTTLHSIAKTLTGPEKEEVLALAAFLTTADGNHNARIYGRTPAHIEALRYKFAAPSETVTPRLDTEEEIMAQVKAREASPSWLAAKATSARLAERSAAARSERRSAEGTAEAPRPQRPAASSGPKPGPHLSRSN